MTLYTIQPGDCLWDISERFYRTPLLWPQLFAFNNRKSSIERTGSVIFDPDLIIIGQKLVIPSKDILTSDGEKIKGKVSEIRKVRIQRNGQTRRQINRIRDLQIQPKSGEAMGRKTAQSVSPPPWEFNLSEHKFPEVQGRGYSLKVSMAGKLKLQSTKTSNTSITVQGLKQLEISSKQSADTEYGKLVSDFKVTNFDPIKGKATFNFGLTTKSNIPNSPEVDLTPQLNERGQMSLKGSVKYQIVKGRIDHHLIAGETIEIALEFAVQDRGARDMSIWSDLADVSLGTVLTVGATALAVGTIVEDIYTLGWGVADDAVSFAVATAMVARAMPLLTKSGARLVQAGKKPAMQIIEYTKSYGTEALIFMGLMSAPSVVSAEDELISSDD